MDKMKGEGGVDLMRTPPIKDDPWGNVANNPTRMKAHMRRLNHQHIVMNRKVTEMEETCKELAAVVCDRDLHIAELEAIHEDDKAEEQILLGKVAALTKELKQLKLEKPKKRHSDKSKKE